MLWIGISQIGIYLYSLVYQCKNAISLFQLCYNNAIVFPQLVAWLLAL